MTHKVKICRTCDGKGNIEETYFSDCWNCDGLGYGNDLDEEWDEIETKGDFNEEV
jgi:DnaJ-class molecular chaperone